MACPAHTYYPIFEPQKKRFKKELTSQKTTLKARSAYFYGFNGKEKDNEVKGEGNSIDFGERMYDPRLGRFKSIDRYFKKYPFLTPYQFAGNCPIKIMDNNGDSLRVTGGAAEITKFKSILNTTFAGAIKVEVDEKGFVTMTGDASKLGANDKALYASLNEVIANKATTDVYLLSESERNLATSGGYRGATINGKKVNTVDVYDMEKFAGQAVSPEGLLIHEIWETYLDQVKGKTFDAGGHDDATAVQAKVDGTFVGAQWGDNAYATTGTGMAYSLYTKKGKLYSLVWDINNYDVQSLSVQEGWVVQSLDGKGTTTLKTAEDIKKYQDAAKKKTAPAKKGG
jgi:RHS repeat-associated protein